MIVQHGHGPRKRLVVISLCDYSGNWPRPFNEAGHTVIQYDLKHGDDVTQLSSGGIAWDIWNTLRPRSTGSGIRVWGVLSAPVCTDFTISGARWWPQKDSDGSTTRSLQLLDACFNLTRELRPEWWALENPVGRIPKLRPQYGRPRMYFHPHEYAGWLLDPSTDAYTKKTGLWGRFVIPEQHRVEPVMYERGGKRGSWMWANLGGKSERTKELRSMTPMGMSHAFATAQIENWA